MKPHNLTTDSFVQISPGGATSYVGTDGVALFRAIALHSGLLMYAKHRMMPNRSWTPTKMLSAASAITGKPYKRGAYLAAAEDVRLWTVAMKAAIPVLDAEGKPHA